MSTKNEPADPVAQAVAAAQAAEDAGIAEFEAAERHLAEVRADQANIVGPAEAAYEAAKQVFGAAKAAKDHANRVAEHTARVAAASTAYTAAATEADEEYARVLEARQHLADAHAGYYPAELARIEAGETVKAEVRALDGIEPGLATAPAVPGKRLAHHRPDAIEEALRSLTVTAHPEAKTVLDRLVGHQPWREPEVAYVQGRRVQIG